MPQYCVRSWKNPRQFYALSYLNPETKTHSLGYLYPFQNETWISNRGGSIFLICDQSDLERHPLPVSFWDGYIWSKATCAEPPILNSNR